MALGEVVKQFSESDQFQRYPLRPKQTLPAYNIIVDNNNILKRICS